MKCKAIRRGLLCLMVIGLMVPLCALGADAGDAFPAADGAQPQAIRVLLSRLSAPERLDITLNGAYTLEYGQTQLMFGRGSDLAVLLKDGRMYVYYADMRVDCGTEFSLLRHADATGAENGLRFANNLSVYEGDLRLTVEEGKMRLILTIGVEDYLKGVVPFEMSDTFPLEALKAQAVAARTYAVSKAAANAAKEYDLVDNTNDQVYKGRRAEYTQAAKAVEETRGICGFYKGNLAMCY